MNYPGSSAEDVEKLITIELERALKDVEGIAELDALSGEQYSILVINVEPSYELENVLSDVRDATKSDIKERAIGFAPSTKGEVRKMTK